MNRTTGCLAFLLAAAFLGSALLAPTASALYNVPHTRCHGPLPPSSDPGWWWAGWTKTDAQGRAVPGYYFYCPVTGIYCQYGNPDDCYGDVVVSTGGPLPALEVVTPTFPVFSPDAGWKPCGRTPHGAVCVALMLP
jgi:hypothetical protein